tara:strand:+ start:199 stop:498 length:300 start_codon:yes stop_codon:yes gene_type:complete
MTEVPAHMKEFIESVAKKAFRKYKKDGGQSSMDEFLVKAVLFVRHCSRTYFRGPCERHVDSNGDEVYPSEKEARKAYMDTGNISDDEFERVYVSLCCSV